MSKCKIIYSLKIMRQLVERGYVPEHIMPNPQYPQYNCWVFAVDKNFQADLDDIMEGGLRHE